METLIGIRGNYDRLGVEYASAYFLILLFPAAILSMAAGSIVRQQIKSRVSRLGDWKDAAGNFQAVQILGRNEIKSYRIALSRQRSSHGRTLDAARTIEASAARAGLFVPVWRHLTGPGELLFLVEKSAKEDHFYYLVEMLARGLRTTGAVVTVAETDPRNPNRVRHAGRWESLHYAVRRIGAQRTLWFCNATRLMEKDSEHLCRWFREVDWGGALTLISLQTAARSKRSLRALNIGHQEVHSLDLVAALELREVGCPGNYPSVLDEPDLWTGHYRPPEARLVRCLDELKIWLGLEEYGLLRELCLSPELVFDQTCLMLLARDPIPFPRLARLFCLPWFRSGRFPRWFREAMLLDAPLRAAERAAVLERLQPGVTQSEVPSTKRREILLVANRGARRLGNIRRALRWAALPAMLLVVLCMAIANARGSFSTQIESVTTPTATITTSQSPDPPTPFATETRTETPSTTPTSPYDTPTVTPTPTATRSFTPTPSPSPIVTRIPPPVRFRLQGNTALSTRAC